MLHRPNGHSKAPLPPGAGAFVSLHRFYQVIYLKISIWEEEIKKPKKERYSRVRSARAVRRSLRRNQPHPRRPNNFCRAWRAGQIIVFAPGAGLIIYFAPAFKGGRRDTYGASLSIFQAPVLCRLYRSLSCRRLGLPCQNSILTGLTR